jgi:hypothetical protein
MSEVLIVDFFLYEAVEQAEPVDVTRLAPQTVLDKEVRDLCLAGRGGSEGALDGNNSVSHECVKDCSETGVNSGQVDVHDSSFTPFLVCLGDFRSEKPRDIFNVRFPADEEQELIVEVEDKNFRG